MTLNDVVSHKSITTTSQCLLKACSVPSRSISSLTDASHLDLLHSSMSFGVLVARTTSCIDHVSRKIHRKTEAAPSPVLWSAWYREN